MMIGVYGRVRARLAYSADTHQPLLCAGRFVAVVLRGSGVLCGSCVSRIFFVSSSAATIINMLALAYATMIIRKTTSECVCVSVTIYARTRMVMRTNEEFEPGPASRGWCRGYEIIIKALKSPRTGNYAGSTCSRSAHRVCCGLAHAWKICVCAIVLPCSGSCYERTLAA